MRNFILTAAAGITLLIGVVGSTPLLSYVSTGWGSVKHMISRQVPIDFEIQRAKDLLASSQGEIRGNLELIARLDKEIVRLDERMAVAVANNTTRDSELRAMKDSGLATKGQILVKFTSLKRSNKELENLTAIKEAKTKNLEALKSRLEEIVTTKEQLAIEIENLETRFTLAQTNKNTDVELSASTINEVKKLVDDLDARIAAEEQMIVDTEMPIEDVHTASLEEVDAYLANQE